MSLINVVKLIKETCENIAELQDFEILTDQDFFEKNFRTIGNTVLIHIPNFAGKVHNRRLKKAISVDIEIVLIGDYLVEVDGETLENFFASLYYTEVISENILTMVFNGALSLDSVEVAGPPSFDDVNNLFASAIRINIIEE